MSKSFKFWLLILVGVLISRFWGMVLFPFAGTTEPRYAEIARLMAETGDWITPWFEPGVAFWGKPPLSFWMQAASIKFFGISEFALRFPSWLATTVMVAMICRLADQLLGARAALWSGLVFATMALTYISAGAVMTDAFLSLGTTMSLVSFYLAMTGAGNLWRWLFFLGIAIGLLAKGPLALVLIGTPIALWLLISWRDYTNLRSFPWWRGIGITLLLACPWYLLAELKTPGFLNYFIVGEHFSRFLDPGWGGDLYGSAHNEPKGMIWMFWVWASFPWGIVALLSLALSVVRGRGGRFVYSALSDRATQFLLLCALTPMLFFTLAGNILWTYILPSLPFTAVLIGRWASERQSVWAFRTRAGLVAFVPVVLCVSVGAVFVDSQLVKTERDLVRHYQSINGSDDSPLFYLCDLPFSARFYSHGGAQEFPGNSLQQLVASENYQRLYVAVPSDWSDEKIVEFSPSARSLMGNRRHQLLVITPLPHNPRPFSNATEVRSNGS